MISVVNYGSFDPFGDRRSLSSSQKTTMILIDFYLAMVDLRPSPDMIQVIIYGGLLKLGIQSTKGLYLDHLPQLATVSEAYVLQRLFIVIFIAFEGIKCGSIFNFCPFQAILGD